MGFVFALAKIIVRTVLVLSTYIVAMLAAIGLMSVIKDIKTEPVETNQQ